ncbi:MAG: nucleotidyltransferase [Symploca sp. SIO2E9]|nr:nucleotidyltransferase [Symploca sp. SIO2E9]
MSRTVNAAFNTFLKEYVNLDPDQTKLAIKSRDWLLEQIQLFPPKDISFPRLFSEKHILFGSFARRTKKRELDDIDIMIALHAEGSFYNEYTDRIEICIPNNAYQLKAFCHENTSILNSKKLINKFISSLNIVPQYENAEIKRNLEAATLKLKSYPWNFDIVPCFFTQKDRCDRDYYLIPDGNGHWKKTDPRIDKNRVIDVCQLHNRNVLHVIRLMKYWNRRRTMPSMSSYLLENMILDMYFRDGYIKASEYVDLEVTKVLRYIKNNIFYPVNDPKNIQGNINTLNYEEKNKVQTRAGIDYTKALKARKLEGEGNHKLSIAKWSEIFGQNFPTYTY